MISTPSPSPHINRIKSDTITIANHSRNRNVACPYGAKISGESRWIAVVDFSNHGNCYNILRSAVRYIPVDTLHNIESLRISSRTYRLRSLEGTMTCLQVAVSFSLPYTNTEYYNIIIIIMDQVYV